MFEEEATTTTIIIVIIITIIVDGVAGTVINIIITFFFFFFFFFLTGEGEGSVGIGISYVIYDLYSVCLSSLLPLRPCRGSLINNGSEGDNLLDGVGKATQHGPLDDVSRGVQGDSILVRRSKRRSRGSSRLAKKTHNIIKLLVLGRETIENYFLEVV